MISGDFNFDLFHITESAAVQEIWISTIDLQNHQSTLSDENIDTRTRINRHFKERFTAKLYSNRTVSWLGPRLWSKIIAPSFPYIEMVPSDKATIKKFEKIKSLPLIQKNKLIKPPQRCFLSSLSCYL